MSQLRPAKKEEEVLGHVYSSLDTVELRKILVRKKTTYKGQLRDASAVSLSVCV